MKSILVVVDMQTDFVDGALGTPEAVKILPNVCEKIKNFKGDIIVTLDTHKENYLSTAEGKNLPVEHCIKGTFGWELHPEVAAALNGKPHTVLEKPTFGSTDLPKAVLDIAGNEDFEITLIGLCTDICVVSNALLLKANFPEKKIVVESALCAGVTPETHNAALTTMKMCQIEVQ